MRRPDFAVSLKKSILCSFLYKKMFALHNIAAHHNQASTRGNRKESICLLIMQLVVQPRIDDGEADVLFKQEMIRCM